MLILFLNMIDHTLVTIIFCFPKFHIEFLPPNSTSSMKTYRKTKTKKGESNRNGLKIIKLPLLRA